MAFYAIEALDDAIDVTRAFLLPFDLGRWGRLALVAFFVGVPGSTVLQFNASTGGAPRGSSGSVSLPFEGAISQRALFALVAALAVAALVIGLVFLLVGSIMEFVLVESLRSEVVTVRRYWSRRWRQGLRLFGFRVVLGLVTIGPFAIVAVLVGATFLLGTPPVVPLFGILLLLPVLLVVGLVVAVIGGFTTAFVVPIMLLEDCGVLAGWRRFWPTLRSQWKQYAVYAVLAFVLSIAAGIVVGIAMAAVGIGLLLLVAVPGAIGFFLLPGPGAAGAALLVVVGVAFLVALLVGFAFVSVPVVTYLRYYALLVLGDTNDAFDLVPGQRAAVRESESW